MLLVGCTSSDSASNHLSERGRNVEACHSLDDLYLKLAADADHGTMVDPTAYEKSFVASWKAIGKRADSPMGDWMIKNIEAAEKAQQNGDTTAEEKGIKQRRARDSRRRFYPATLHESRCDTSLNGRQFSLEPPPRLVRVPQLPPSEYRVDPSDHGVLVRLG